MNDLSFICSSCANTSPRDGKPSLILNWRPKCCICGRLSSCSRVYDPNIDPPENANAGNLVLVDEPEHGYVQVRPDTAPPFDADSPADQALAWETTVHVGDDGTLLLENALDRLDGRNLS